MTLALRPERAGEEAAIHALTARAFAGHPHSDGAEPHVIDRLRAAGDLVLSLVALEDDAIVGQVTYSRAILADGSQGWMALGPIAVEPARHGQGIGRALIERGEAEMRALGAKGIVLLGDPAIYRRFGFRQHTPMQLPGELGEFLQVLSFGDPIPAAQVSFAPAFG